MENTENLAESKPVSVECALGGKPTEAGEYEIWCEESEEWTPVTITAEPWGLLVHCPDTGGNPLNVYHDALTAVMWRKAP